MTNHFKHILSITIILSCFACKENIIVKDEDNSKTSTTSVKVNWKDSLPETEDWIKEKDVEGFTGSTSLGDLSTLALDSAIEEKYDLENSFEGSIPNSTIEKFHYPIKSNSGGDVTGFYDQDRLIKIESKFDAEFGYSAIIVHFEDGEIGKINYQRYFADYKKYRRDYTDSRGIDPAKLTYTDTTFIYEFGDKVSSKKYAGKKFVSTKIRKGLLEHLLECARKMENELSYEREFSKQ